MNCHDRLFYCCFYYYYLLFTFAMKRLRAGFLYQLFQEKMEEKLCNCFWERRRERRYREGDWNKRKKREIEGKLRRKEGEWERVTARGNKGEKREIVKKMEKVWGGGAKERSGVDKAERGRETARLNSADIKDGALFLPPQLFSRKK